MQAEVTGKALSDDELALQIRQLTASIDVAVCQLIAFLVEFDVRRLRDGGCRFPGCGAHRFVDGHYIRHWADGSETSLDNLVTCRTHHHRMPHEGGFSVERIATGGVVFRTPGGHVVQEHLPNAGHAPLPMRKPSDWLWEGSSLDWCVAVEELQHARPEFSWHGSV